MRPQQSAVIRGVNTFDRVKPSYLLTSEQERRTLYWMRAQYYDPGPDGLYLSSGGDGMSLRDIRRWTKENTVKNPYYPKDMEGYFNPVRKIVNTDVSSLMNEFQPEGITTDSTALTKWIQEALYENRFHRLFRKLFRLTASQGDAYVKSEQAENKSKVRLVVYPGDGMFPLLDVHDDNRVLSYRNYYQISRITPVRSITGPVTYDERPGIECYCLIEPFGQTYWEDEVEVPEYSYDYPWHEIPVSHFAFTQYDDWYGQPSVTNDVLAVIDRINFIITSMWRRTKRLLYAQVMCSGFSGKEIKLGDTFFYDVPEGSSTTVLEFDMPTGYLTFLDKLIVTIKEQLPYYTLEQVDSTKVGMTAASVSARYGRYISYAEDIEAGQADSIRDMIRQMCMVAGKGTDVEVKVNMGPVISEEVTTKLDTMQKETDLFGDTDIMARRHLTELNMKPEEQEELLASRKAAKPKTMADLIAERRMKKGGGSDDGRA